MTKCFFCDYKKPVEVEMCRECAEIFSVVGMQTLRRIHDLERWQQEVVLGHLTALLDFVDQMRRLKASRVNVE
jgi:hypothetical protein